MNSKSRSKADTSNNIRIINKIGKEITSTLDLEKVLFNVYEGVNELMDASIFGIGLYDKEKQQIEYKLAIENGIRYEAYTRDMKNKNQIPVWCIDNQKNVLINDVFNEYQKYIVTYKDDNDNLGDLENGAKPLEALSMIYIPILIKENVIGLITVQSMEKNAYTENDVEVLSNIASYAAIALENSRLYHNMEIEIQERTKEVRKQKEELENNFNTVKTLSKIGREITSSLDFEKILFIIYEHVNLLMNANVFGIGLYDEEKKVIEYKLAIANNVKYKPYTRSVEDKNQFPVWCIENNKSILINNVYEEYQQYIAVYEPPDKELEDGSKAGEVNSLIYLPIRIKERVIGIITVQSSEKNAYKPHHLEILESIASYSAIAFHNARLYETLEDKVELRTTEITQQKEEIEKTYKSVKSLSEIGLIITATLSVPEIIARIYENINTLIDASIFAIGIYNKKNNTLDFYNHIEKGEKQPFFPLSLENKQTFPSYCFLNKKEIITGDTKKTFGELFGGKEFNPLIGSIPNSLIYIPLISKKKAIGVVSVQSFKENAYSQHDLNILQNLAVYTSIAIENARLYQNMETEVKERTIEVIAQKEELENSYQNVKTLSKLGQSITSTFDLEKILMILYQHISKIMRADTFGIGLYKKERNKIDYSFAIADGVRYKSYERDTTDKSQLPVWCIDHKKSIHISNVYEECTKYIPNYDDYGIDLANGKQQSSNVYSIIYVPLIIKNEILGVLSVQSYNMHAYTTSHVEIVETISSYAAIAIHNAELYENMEEEVKNRTIEVTRQKEEIEKTHDNNRLLSEMGLQITSTLNFEEIFSLVYNYLVQLMDVGCFGVRIYHEDTQLVEYKYEIERGIRSPEIHSVSMEDVDNYSVWCIKNQKEIFIGDNLTEYHKYTRQIKVVSGDMPSAVIFYPIMIKNRILGAITIQSFVKHAYTKYHLNILKTLASYAAIALENASLYETLEEKVKERTLEVVQQKEEINHAFQNIKLLSEIGQTITSSLKIEKIFETMYQNINRFMKSSNFGIRLYHLDRNCIEYKYEIEGDLIIPPIEVSMDDENNYAVWCVKNKKEIVINDHENEYNKYVKKLYVSYGSFFQSLMFCPMTVGDRILGVVTVQSAEKNAYSNYHLDILRTLASYTAIAFDNAKAYLDLNTALIRLQSTPQLVQAEKMASLGQLTAGIAHEINNPVNFISANINPLKRDLEDIITLLAEYTAIKNEHDFKEKYWGIEQLKKEIDSDYLIKEIKDLLDGIEEGTKRTTEIVKGLRNFSRLDENLKKKANIHEGLDNTLTLLKNKYKDRIEIFRDYHEIPDLDCYPGQLNQVFMNILSNSIQAIEGSGAIWIKTWEEHGSIVIKIKDSGIGMSYEVKSKIFDPFFTTKDVGVGTGLGLSITYGIIEKHKGKIEVESEQGKGAEFTITLPLNTTEE